MPGDMCGFSTLEQFLFQHLGVDVSQAAIRKFGYLEVCSSRAESQHVLTIWLGLSRGSFAVGFLPIFALCSSPAGALNELLSEV